jgi:hypothetical protein
MSAPDADSLECAADLVNLVLSCDAATRSSIVHALDCFAIGAAHPSAASLVKTVTELSNGVSFSGTAAAAAGANALFVSVARAARALPLLPRLVSALRDRHGGP